MKMRHHHFCSRLKVGSKLKLLLLLGIQAHLREWASVWCMYFVSVIGWVGMGLEGGAGTRSTPLRNKTEHVTNTHRQKYTQWTHHHALQQIGQSNSGPTIMRCSR